MTKATKNTEKGLKDVQVSISKDAVTVTLNGKKVEITPDGNVTVSQNDNRTAPANDTAIKAAKDALELGTKMADGSVYAGTTAEGKLIFALPQDLDVTMTFNDAAKAVKKLNKDKALGYNDWEIPSLENLRILQKNKDEGSLKGTFNLTGNRGSGSDYPDFYWSSTENRVLSSVVPNVRFSDSYEDWDRKGTTRLSCRPVRIVAAAASPQ